MTGKSEKQIAFANEIKQSYLDFINERISGLSKRIEKQNEKGNTERAEELKNVVSKCNKQIENITENAVDDSTFWLNFMPRNASDFFNTNCTLCVESDGIVIKTDSGYYGNGYYK